MYVETTCDQIPHGFNQWGRVRGGLGVWATGPNDTVYFGKSCTTTDRAWSTC